MADRPRRLFAAAKPVAIFLAVFVPLLLVLVRLSREDARPMDLPAEPPLDVRRALVRAEELGETRVRGSVLLFRDLELLATDGDERLYLKVDELVREEGRPRLRGVLCAAFAAPPDAKPVLRVTLHAPYLDADPAVLLAGREDVPIEMKLVGGVAGHDALGRTLLETEQLVLLLRERQVFTDTPILLRLPERYDVEVRAAGLRGAWSLKTVRLLPGVSVSFLFRGGAGMLTCDGEAVARGVSEGGEIAVQVERNVRCSHPLAVVTCERGEVVLRRSDAGVEERPVRGLLEGSVRVAPDPDRAEGLEEISCERVRFADDELHLEGALRGRWTGVLQAGPFGAGERRLSFAADRSVLRGVLGEGDRFTLDEIELLGGVQVQDEDGAGEVAASRVVIARDGEAWRLFAEGGVSGRTVVGRFAAASFHARFDAGREVESIEVRGLEDLRVEVLPHQARKIGAGWLRMACTGPLTMEAVDGEAVWRATGDVTASFDAHGEEVFRLRSDGVEARVGRAGTRFLASGAADFVHHERKLSCRGDSIAYDGSVLEVEGSPAVLSISGDDRGDLRARRLEAQLNERRFLARGDVSMRAAFGKDAGEWLVSCADLAGEWDEQQEPVWIEASGPLRATGPEGHMVEGSRFRYDLVDGEGVGSLDGSPARLSQGEDLTLEAPGLDLRFRDREIVAAATRGAGRLSAVDRQRRWDVARWEADLAGPAVFKDGAVVLADGAALRALDDDGKKLLSGRAPRVVLSVHVEGDEFLPTAVRASGGVVISTQHRKKPVTLASRELSYGFAENRVLMEGDGSADYGGGPGAFRFRKLSFILTKGGIDDLRLSEGRVEPAD